MTTTRLKDTSISADFISVSLLSAAIDSLDNRLSDIEALNPETATSAYIVDTLSTIITRFGGNK